MNSRVRGWTRTRETRRNVTERHSHLVRLSQAGGQGEQALSNPLSHADGRLPVEHVPDPTRFGQCHERSFPTLRAFKRLANHQEVALDIQSGRFRNLARLLVRPHRRPPFRSSASASSYSPPSSSASLARIHPLICSSDTLKLRVLLQWRTPWADVRQEADFVI